MSLDWEGGFNMPTSKLYTIIVLEKAVLSEITRFTHMMMIYICIQMPAAILLHLNVVA